MYKLLITFILLLTPNLSTAEEIVRRMTLTGVGEVFVVPDMATVTLGVGSIDKKASDAMRANSSAMAKVFEKLKDAGIEARDIQTSQLSLNPRWERATSNNAPRIIGYEAMNTVTVRVRALDTVGTVLDVLSQAGANRINQISFGIQKPRPHQDEARKRAVADARVKAALYAQAAGVTLGAIISINENGAVAQPRALARMEMAAVADSAVPVAKGELGMQAHVTIVYEIK
jgi:uncharacterized protein YggE